MIDSLSKTNYEALKNNIKNHDSILSSMSIHAYLLKSKKSKDTANIIYGYQRFIYAKKKTNYYDSIIHLLEESNNKKFNEPLSIAYYGKGSLYYSKYKFDESLKYYLKANKLLPGSDIDMNIGLIRIRTGEYNEALKIFQNINTLKKNNNSDALWLYFALAETHRHLKNCDSTDFYINLGHREVFRTKIFERKPYFSLMQGANNYGKKKYQQSIDTMLVISSRFIDNKDQANLMFNYYFIGISNYKLSKKHLALKYFNKVDSLYEITKHIEPEFRKAYEILIHESSKKNDINLQLKHVNRLIKIDSSLAKEYKFIAKNLYEKYDSPKLLADKQKLINQINKKNSKAQNWLKTSILFVLILSLVVIYFIKQNSKNRKKFKQLLENTEKSKATIRITKEKKLNINPEVVNVILNKIEKFEDKKGYYKTNITLNNLSKEFDTNSKYLSQIIKHYKHKKFTDYINSLRIENAIKELKKNDEYKKYTLKAIAYEFGFNSIESFSSAFYKNTGLKPSYFLKELWQKK